MKLPIFILTLLLAFSPFVQAQTEPSEEEGKSILDYVNKYGELQNIIQNASQQFNELTVSQKGAENELTSAKQMYIKNIDETIKIFTAMPAPPACKELRLKMLAELNGMRIIADKTVNDVYQKQANKEIQCTGCSAAKHRAFKLRSADEKQQSEKNALEKDKLLADIGKKYGFSMIDDKVQEAKSKIFNNGLAYVAELMLIIDFFEDANSEIVTAINNAIDKPSAAADLAKAITKYQNNCKEGSKLLLAFPKSYNGDGNLWSIAQELSNFSSNYGQKTLPAILAACNKEKRLNADITVINAGIAEYQKAQPLMDKSIDAYYAFLEKLLKDKK